MEAEDREINQMQQKVSKEFLFPEERDIELPIFNHITIPEDEKPFDAHIHEESQGKGIPFYPAISRMMYAAGDLSKPNPDCVMVLITFMKTV